MKHRFLLLLSLMFLLSGCNSGDFEEPVSTETVVSTETQAPLPESNYPMALEVISPENVDRLEQIDRWGEGNIHSVAVSPDEKTIAVYTVSGIHLYDSMTLEETQFIDTGISNENPPYKTSPIAFSPDGRLLAYGDGHVIVFWDLILNQNERRIYTLYPDWAVTGIEFSPDGNRILILTKQGSVYSPCDGFGYNYALYSTKGEILFDTYACDYYIYGNYRFTTDGKLYIFLDSMMNIQHPSAFYMVDIFTGSLLKTGQFGPAQDYTTHDPKDSFYDISSDGKYIVSLIYENEQPISLVKEADTGKIIKTVEGFVHFINSDDGELKWAEGFISKNLKNYENEECGIMNGANWGGYSEVLSYGSKVMLTFGHLKTNSVLYLELWDVSKCEIEKEISFPSARAMKFSPNGQYLVTRDIYGFYIWNTKSKEIEYSIPDKGGVNWWEQSYIFNSNGDKLITQRMNSDDNTCQILIWNTQTGNLFRSLTPFVCSDFYFFSSPVSNIIAMYQRNKRELQFWDIDTGEFLYTVPIEKPTFEASGDFWGIVGEDEQVKKLVLFEIQTGSELQVINTPYQRLNIVYSSEDNSRLVTRFFDPDEDKTYVVIFDTETGKQISKIIIEDGIEQSFTWFLRDRFVIDTHDGYLHFWKYGQDMPYLTIQVNLLLETVNDNYSGYRNDIYQSIVFSPYEEVAITFNQYSNLIRFWDTQTGRLLGEITPTYELEDIALSPDGRIIAVSGEDGLIRIWGVPEE